MSARKFHSPFVKEAKRNPDRVWVFDTTLRDGEQSPGASLTTPEKVEIARSLEAMGVDIIEAGFPITSEDDFEAVRSVAAECRRARITGLARCVPADIRRAGEALEGARRPRIHVFLATSAIHRKYKLKKAKSEIVRLAVDGVRLARKLCEEVEFSPEDASRTENEFLAEVVEAAIAAGASVVNIPDTVGYALPERFAEQISYLRETVPNIEDAVISVHCHNDLGLAVANTLSAVTAGARQAEVTVNGLGERAGNAALEEVVMTLKTRRDQFGLTTGIDTTRIVPTSRQVSKLTGLVVQRNKAIVGENAFAHEAGIHVHGVLSHRETYEIMSPKEVGLAESRIVIGKHTGHHAIEARIRKMGYKVSRKQLDRVREAVKRLADRKKNIYDADLEAILRDEVARVEEMFSLYRFQVMTGKGLTPMATVTLCVRPPAAGGKGKGKGEGEGEGKDEDLRTDASAGDGPVSAIFTAIDRITGVQGTLLEYRIEAVTGGREAMGEVHIMARFDGTDVPGHGASPDILEASALAYLQAVNRFVARGGSKRAAKRAAKKKRRG